MIFFDIDGVLRNLDLELWGHHPKTWMKDVNGVSVFDYVNSNKDVLVKAKPTEYVPVVQDFAKISHQPLMFLTHQPPEWIPYTEKWLRKHFNSFYIVKYVNCTEDKIPFLEELQRRRLDTILIDDHPILVGHDLTITLDRPYNQGETWGRIKTPEELNDFLIRTIK